MADIKGEQPKSNKEEAPVKKTGDKIQIKKKNSSKPRKTIPYFDYLTDSFKLVWQNKAIILISLIFVFFGGSAQYGSNLNFNTNSFNNITSTQDQKPDYQDIYYNDQPKPFEELTNETENLAEEFEDIKQKEWFVPVAVGVGCIGLIYFLAGIYFRTVIRGALIKIEKINREGKNLNFQTLWKEGSKSMMDIALIWLTLIPLNILYGIASIPLFCCVCIGWIILFILAILFGYFTNFMYRYKVLTDATIGESITLSFNLIKDEFSQVITYILFSIAVNIAISILSLITFAPFIVTAVIAAINAIWILLAISVILFIIVSILLSSVLVPTLEIFNTKVFLDLITE